jgi:prephenate dehydrogenase
LTVVCTPVELIADAVRGTAATCPANGLITDAGSTKARLVAELETTLPPAAHFVGSHPLAGSEKQGPADARADLFVDRVVVLTPSERSRPDDCAAIAEFWTDLGARVVSMSPEKHDETVALSSHLPHLVAAALMAAVPDEALSLAAGGLRDTTRVAAGDAELWTQIVFSNRQHILRALDRFADTLVELRAALAAHDREGVKHFLQQAKQQRDALGN